LAGRTVAPEGRAPNVPEMTAPIPPAPPSGPSREWTGQVAEAVESAVLAVKDKTTVPLTTIARAVVYGLVIAALGAMAAVAVAVAAIRVLTVYLPVGRAHGTYHRVWVADLIVGGIFTASGLFAWSRRTSKEAGK